jgi:hypothetical protein
MARRASALFGTVRAPDAVRGRSEHDVTAGAYRCPSHRIAAHSRGQLQRRVGAGSPLVEDSMRLPILSLSLIAAMLLGLIQLASAQSPTSYPYSPELAGSASRAHISARRRPMRRPRAAARTRDDAQFAVAGPKTGSRSRSLTPGEAVPRDVGRCLPGSALAAGRTLRLASSGEGPPRRREPSAQQSARWRDRRDRSPGQRGHPAAGTTGEGW